MVSDSKFIESGHSWKIISNNVAAKILDRSAFVSNETGIPVDMRAFFEIDEMRERKRRAIILEYNGNTYIAHIRMGAGDSPKSKMTWPANFTDNFKQLFPNINENFKMDVETSADRPLLILEKFGKRFFKVSFKSSLDDMEVSTTFTTTEQKIFPSLEPTEREREYVSYKQSVRDVVVFEYLFNSKSHRRLDENILGLDSKESKGYQSMGILHFIGLRDIHKGFFKEDNLLDAINLLEDQGDELRIVVDSLLRISKGIIDNQIDSVHDVRIDEEGLEYPEGREAYKVHRYRERNRTLVQQAKARFIQIHGKLYCEACGINFEEKYGERGKGYIEAHHIKPVSEMKEGEKTRVEELAMLCSNCHRMIHRKPFIRVSELKRIIRIDSDSK